MWLLLLAVFLYLLIPKDTTEERKDQEDLIDDILFLGDEDEDEDMLIEELVFLLEDKDEF